MSAYVRQLRHLWRVLPRPDAVALRSASGYFVPGTARSIVMMPCASKPASMDITFEKLRKKDATIVNLAVPRLDLSSILVIQ